MRRRLTLATFVIIMVPATLLAVVGIVWEKLTGRVPGPLMRAGRALLEFPDRVAGHG